MLRLRTLSCWALAGGLSLGIVACGTPGTVMQAAAEGTSDARILYRQQCAACHGDQGTGDGPMAWWLPAPPRDFQHEPFRYISSASGAGVDLADLERTIRRGILGAGMPASPHLGDTEVQELAELVLAWRRAGMAQDLLDYAAEEDEEMSPEEALEIADSLLESGGSLPVPPRPEDYVFDLDRAAALFAANCAACHGADGRGDGVRGMTDEQGRPIQARDFVATGIWGGRTDRDLYWRIRLGMPGTPMPATEIADEDVWQLVDYVRVLAQG